MCGGIWRPEGSFVYLQYKGIKVMRYIVRVVKDGEIKNIYSTNDHFDAIAVERTAKEIYDDVWICDCVMEMLVG